MCLRAFAAVATPIARAALPGRRGTGIINGMPLRAKLALACSQRRHQHSEPTVVEYKDYGKLRETILELPEDDPDDVMFSTRFGLRMIELNRPKKLNALNASMIRKIVPRLAEWEKSDMANVVVIKSTGGKAFCAGGDVRAVAERNQANPDGWRDSVDYFSLEYKLMHYIATYQTPYIAVMNGITMGGGAGLCMHAPFRVATESTVFAMPETEIGFFPDVGASFFLPRLNGYVGTYLALTGARVTSANVLYSGIATHYIHSTILPSLEGRLSELRFKDYDSLQRRLTLVRDTLDEYATGLPPLAQEPLQLGGEIRKAIDRCFGRETVPQIIRALEQEEGETRPWAMETLMTLRKKSPTSLHVTLRQMRAGLSWSIRDTYLTEYRMARKFMTHPDFNEGVMAKLVRKKPPVWQPASLDDIPPNEDIAWDFFAPGLPGSELQLLTDRDFSRDSPHQEFQMPTERWIFNRFCNGQPIRRTDIVHQAAAAMNWRQGSKEIVWDILERMTVEDEQGLVCWVG